MIGAETNLIVTVSDLKSDFKSDFKSERAPRTPLNHSFDAVYEKTLSRGDTGDESREIRFGSGNAERVRAGKSGSEGKNGAGRKSGIERKNGFERGAVQEDEPENGDGELLEEDKTGVSARYEWLAPLMMAAVHSEAPAVTPEASAAPVLETGLTLGFAGLEPDGAVFPEMGLAPEGLTVSGTG
ncbi:MAG: hypothetical protein LBL26_04040, partial [Peptococcaceae bacterium]|nr:hypothetical protein [Peptococcaceae bacterium]